MYNDPNTHATHTPPKYTHKKSKRSRQTKQTKRNRHSSFDIYVVRLDLMDDMTYARPCTYCTNTMKCLGVKKIFYSDWGGGLKMEYASDMISNNMSVWSTKVAHDYRHLPVNATKSIRF